MAKRAADVLKGGAMPDLEDAETVGGLLRFQSAACGYVGSPLYEDLLRRAADDYEAGGPTSRVLAGHEDDPKDSALALRLLGAVHRLVLTGRAPALAERYAAADGDGERTWAAFHRTLEDRVAELRALVGLPVQTNEVGRCAALLPGFLDVAARTGKPLRLLEVGSSAGLNLHWDDYRYEAEGFAWGSPASPLRIEFELSGGARLAPVAATVVERAGCDASPVDPAGEEGRLTLLSYCWPDQPVRMERLRAALEIAGSRPAPVERSGAVEWVAARLADRTAVVQHAAYPHEGRALFGGDAVVLSRTHRELLQAEPFGELVELPEVRSRLLWIACEWRHRRETPDLHRSALEKGFELLRRDA